MLSPGFIDGFLLLVLAGFAAKGWITGFIRSTITLIAVIGGWILSGMVPMLMGPMLHYSVPTSSPFHAVITRIATFMLMFCLVQAGGFAITGLIENIRMGSLDKFVGLALGVLAGVLAGCFIVSTFFTHPTAYWSPAGKRYESSSMLFKAYAPMVRKFVRVPHNPSDDDAQ
jgi:uncharacterized membrane protein required for colicin V production